MITVVFDEVLSYIEKHYETNSKREPIPAKMKLLANFIIYLLE